MEIAAKHVRAGFEAGLEGFKAMEHRPHQMQLAATPAELTARGAPRLQACINAVELPMMMMMLGKRKEQLSGL